jgi:hypothetical protein
MKMVYRGYDRGELCAYIARHRYGNHWVLYWPRRQWAQERFRTLEKAKAWAEHVLAMRNRRYGVRQGFDHPIEWKR